MLLQDRAAQSDAPSERTEQWEPAETALIVCDMWNLHHCLNATRRVRPSATRRSALVLLTVNSFHPAGRARSSARRWSGC